MGWAVLGAGPTGLLAATDDPKPQKKPAAKKKEAAKKPSKAKADGAKDEKRVRVRWGKRRKESDGDYDKRYARLLKKVKLDKEGSIDGGPSRLWTYMGHPFIVRSDIDQEFTADAAMYMEMLHREYGQAYSKLLGGVPARIKEKIEVVIFKDRKTYAANGGGAGSGGQFMTHPSFGDRGPHWPALHYRLMQFTDGIADFAKWPKGVLKHEAAHMELQMRLGMVLIPQVGFSVAVDCPRWWNEGHASVFEYWDFDKTVDDNLAEIPNRGRYAPVIRRIHKTDRWKNFDYVWKIDAKSWHGDMTSDQGFLNYAQAWSLAAYMMSGDKKGRKDFQAIFNLSKRVGADRQTTYKGDGLRAWDLAFPEEDRTKMEANWNDWLGKHVRRDQRVPDEDYHLILQGFDPKVVDKLEPLDKDSYAELRGKMKKAEKKRHGPKHVEK